MKIDFTASIVTRETGLRQRIENAAVCYNPACSGYFADILNRRGEAFYDSASGFILLDSLLLKNKVNRLELVITPDSNGRPRTNAPDIDLSISHSEGCALCALALGEDADEKANVGVDIQHVRNYSFEKMCSLAKIFMTDRELESFCAQTIEFNADSFMRRREDFFSSWARREAYVKRVGLDIFDHLKSAQPESEYYREGVIEACGERYCYAICSPAYEPKPDTPQDGEENRSCDEDFSFERESEM